MRPWLGICLGLWMSGTAWAQTDPVFLTQRAQGQLQAAALALEAAEGAQDRVAALTQTVRAYEAGLTAMRAGLRAAARRERALTRAFEAKRADVARLLGVLASIGSAPAPLSLLHPSGPLGTARSGMVLAEITPALQREANALRAELEELLLLRALQEGAAASVTDALAGAQTARVALARAVADRTDLPARFATDPDRMRDLLQTADTLAAFAAGLGVLESETPAPLSLEARRGDLALPVDGVLALGFQETDAEGVSRPGLTLATQPAALVTAPLAGTLRYVGPLLDYGNVILLEPGDRLLMVFAGLGEAYGQAGDVVEAGAPLGLMGGATPDSEEFLVTPAQGAGSLRTETLYIEVRRDEEPQDPAGWFAIERK